MATKQILVGGEKNILMNAKLTLAGDTGLKPGGNALKACFLKGLQKYLMVFTLSFFHSPEYSHQYDLAQTTKEAVKFDCLQQLYQRFCIQFVRKEGFFSTDEFKAFYQEEIDPIVQSYGCSSIALMTLVATSVSKTAGFKEVTGRSVSDLGMHAAREFHYYSREFAKLLDGQKKVPTGEQWKTLLRKFKRLLYEKQKEDDAVDSESDGEASVIDDKGDGELADNDGRVAHNSEHEQDGEIEGDNRTVGNPPPPMDPFDEFAITDESNDEIPLQWMPGKKHGWLLFLCFGEYGINVFKSSPLFYLSKLNGEELDQIKRSRAESKASSSEKGNMVSVLIARRERREGLKEAFEMKRQAISDKINDTLSEIQVIKMISEMADDGDEKREALLKVKAMLTSITELKARREELQTAYLATMQTAAAEPIQDRNSSPVPSSVGEPLSEWKRHGDLSDVCSHSALEPTETNSSAMSRSEAPTLTSDLLTLTSKSRKLNKDGTPRKLRSDAGTKKQKTASSDEKKDD